MSNLAARIGIYAATTTLLGLIFWQVGDLGIETLDNHRAQIVMGAGLFRAEAFILLPFAHTGPFLYEPCVYAVLQFLLEAWVLITCEFVQVEITIPVIALGTLHGPIKNLSSR